MKAKIIGTLGLFALLASAAGFAGPSPASVLRANIDFSFTLAGRLLPPGLYDFWREDLSDVFKVTGPDNQALIAPIITRLSGEIHTTPEDAHLVFDKIGDTFLLSELWIPGEDGYLLQTAKGIHEHIILNIKL